MLPRCRFVSVETLGHPTLPRTEAREGLESGGSVLDGMKDGEEALCERQLLRLCGVRGGYSSGNGARLEGEW